MIKHIVLYKLREDTQENRKALVNKFMSMQGKIPQLKSIQSGSDVLNSFRSFNVALICEFENIDDMKIYIDCPVHCEVKEYVGNVVEQSKCVDFEF